MPTPEIRAHSLYFDLSAYGVEAFREHRNQTTKPGFHLKIYGTFRNRYMALVCPASDTKMVRFLRQTAHSSVRLFVGSVFVLFLYTLLTGTPDDTFLWLYLAVNVVERQMILPLAFTSFLICLFITFHSANGLLVSACSYVCWPMCVFCKSQKEPKMKKWRKMKYTPLCVSVCRERLSVVICVVITPLCFL